MRVDKGSAGEEEGRCSSEQSEKGKWQTLSLQQLNDLQSKLMLVAGKALEGKEQVDRFVEVMETSSAVSVQMAMSKNVKGKVLPYLLPSVGPGADHSVQAVK